MAEPTKKDPAIEEFLTGSAGFDRREVIRSNKCAPPPIGCGRDVDPTVDANRIEQGAFRDHISLKEYSISGLCQGCQDGVFGSDP